MKVDAEMHMAGNLRDAGAIDGNIQGWDAPTATTENQKCGVSLINPERPSLKPCKHRGQIQPLADVTGELLES